MKYLQDYMTERQTAAMDKAGAFFAFGEKQLIEAMNERGIKEKEGLIQISNGFICPKENAKDLIASLDNIYRESIAQDVKENGLEKVILRELSNHEAYYTGEIESTVEALSDYPVTPDQIRKMFNNKKAVL